MVRTRAVTSSVWLYTHSWAMLLKLSTSDKDEPHFVRVNIHLGYGGNQQDKAKAMKIATELNARKIQIVDLVRTIITGRSKEQLDDQGEQEELKEEIKDRVNMLLQDGRVDQVYFEEFSIM